MYTSRNGSPPAEYGGCGVRHHHPDPLGSRGAVIDIHVHAVRLRGMVAHQEILLGDPGQQLVIRHDFGVRPPSCGVLLGVREVQPWSLNVKLDACMDLS